MSWYENTVKKIQKGYPNNKLDIKVSPGGLKTISSGSEYLEIYKEKFGSISDEDWVAFFEHKTKLKLILYRLKTDLNSLFEPMPYTNTADFTKPLA